MPLFGGKKGEPDALSILTSRLSEQTKAFEAFKADTHRLIEDRDKAIKALAEKVRGVMDSVTNISQTVEKLGQGIPTNPILEQSVKDMPLVKTQLANAINRLGQIEKTIAETNQTILAKIEGIELSQTSMSPPQGGAPIRSSGAWGSRNIETQIQAICKDLVRALPKELQPSAQTALDKATKAFMDEFVRNFSQGLRPARGGQRQVVGATTNA